MTSARREEVFDLQDLRFAQACRQLDSSGRFSGVLSLVRGDGSPFPADVSLSRYREGDAEGVALIFKDYTGFSEVESALGESEKRYRIVVEQAAEGIFLVDASTALILESNAAFQALVGYTSEELESRTIYDIIASPDNDVESVKRNIERVLEKRSALLGERDYRRKDGTVVPVEVKASAIHHDGREVLCVIAHDVTERKRYEEHLRESRDRLRLVVDAAELGTWELDPARGEVRWDEKCMELYGILPDVRMTYDLFLKVLHPRDRERTQRAVEEALDPRSGGGYQVEYRTVRPSDGSERWVSASGQAYFDESGRPVRFVGTSLDITDRKRAEEGVKRSLNLLLALHEAGHVLGSTLEAEEIATRLLRIMHNVSSLTATVISVQDDRGEVHVWRSVGLEDLWDKARYALEAEDARRAALENNDRTVFKLRRPGGKGYLVGLCLPLRVRDRVIGLLEAYGPEDLAEEDAVGILSSLSIQAASALDNARLYRELAEREQQLHELVGKLLIAQEEERRRVARDIHDGLTQIASASYLNLQAFARDHVSESSPQAREDIERITTMIQQTSRESRRVIADLWPMSLDDLGLRAALSSHIEGLRRDGWEIGYEETLGGARLPGDIENVLFRIAQEAMTNARKHARTNRIHLTLRRTSKAVRIRVRDWGCGFDPDAVYGDEGAGEKLGLSGMKERAKLMGAEFRVYSKPGKGTLIVASISLEENRQASRSRAKRSPVGRRDVYDSVADR